MKHLNISGYYLVSFKVRGKKGTVPDLQFSEITKLIILILLKQALMDTWIKKITKQSS